jgi:hypothetical protein
MPRAKKGGARLSERGLASYLREKYYFGAEGSPSYALFRFLSAVVHSPDTKPMPRHPFSSLLEGNEASADKALDAIVKANGWQRYVKINGRWGEGQQGFSVVPTVAQPAGASASSSSALPPAPEVNPWATSGSKRGAVVLDPGGGGGEPVEEEEYVAPEEHTGLSLPMASAGFGDEDEGEPEGTALAEAVASGAQPAEAVAQPAEANEPPKPKGKKPKKEKAEEVDLEAEARASKIAFFKQVKAEYKKEYSIPQFSHPISLAMLEDTIEKTQDKMAELKPKAESVKKQMGVLAGLSKTLKRQYDELFLAIRSGGERGQQMNKAYNEYLDRIEPLKKTNVVEYRRLKEAKEGDKIAIEELRSELTRMASESETVKERFDKTNANHTAKQKELDEINKEGQEASDISKTASDARDKNPAYRLINTLRDKGWLDEYNAGEWQGKGRYRGSGARPPNNILQKIAVQSYKPNPERVVGDFILFRATPTLKFYKQGNTVVVGVRGTVPSDMEDVKADGLIALNQLEGSPRFQKDLAVMRQVKNSMPRYDFYGVGHSLGGAVLDGLLRENLMISGVSYNPAVQPKDFNSNIPNSRIYQKGDPLYALGKNFLKNAPEVREAKPMSWKDRLISYVPYAGTVYNYLNAHNLSNFEGGRKSAVSPTPSNPLSREEYLSRVRAKAKSEGYPYKLLGYADDDKHKFQIPNAEGKIIRFGRKGYGDFHIWSALEASGKVEKGYAENKRKVFHNSHNKIKGRWRSDLFSPNNLALKILW